MNFIPTQELMITPHRQECQRVYVKCLERANGMPLGVNYAYVKGVENKINLHAVTMDLQNSEQCLVAISRTINMPDFIGWVFDSPSYISLTPQEPIMDIHITQEQILEMVRQSAQRLAPEQQMPMAMRAAAQWQYMENQQALRERLDPNVQVQIEKWIEEDEHIANPQAFLAKQAQTLNMTQAIELNEEARQAIYELSTYRMKTDILGLTDEEINIDLRHQAEERTLDLTDATGEEVMAVFKAMSPDDKIEIVDVNEE